MHTPRNQQSDLHRRYLDEALKEVLPLVQRELPAIVREQMQRMQRDPRAPVDEAVVHTLVAAVLNDVPALLLAGSRFRDDIFREYLGEKEQKDVPVTSHNHTYQHLREALSRRVREEISRRQIRSNVRREAAHVLERPTPRSPFEYNRGKRGKAIQNPDPDQMRHRITDTSRG